MKILWLASWYPSQIEPFNGDFVQRHAEAVSLYHDIEVIHVIKDPTGAVTKNIHIELKQRGRLKEWIVYYHNPFQKLPLLGRIFSQLRFRRVFQMQLKRYLQENGRPHLVHVHVCLKAGLLALWLKRKYKLPYVVTEHSSQFLPEAENYIQQSTSYLRLACQRILQNASGISAVSNALGKAMQAFIKRDYVVIPNVVDTSIFNLREKEQRGICRFLHVSGLGDLKNPQTILKAFALLKRKRDNFSLAIVGSESEKIKRMATELGLKHDVIFHPEMPQHALVTFMQEADALILFSRYETFGCVLIEANACGTPAVVNDLPVMKETVSNGFNGLVVQSTTEALADALSMFLEGKASFNPGHIAAHAAKNYGYEKVGAAFSQFYSAAIET